MFLRYGVSAYYLVSESPYASEAALYCGIIRPKVT